VRKENVFCSSEENCVGKSSIWERKQNENLFREIARKFRLKFEFKNCATFSLVFLSFRKLFSIDQKPSKQEKNCQKNHEWKIDSSRDVIDDES
jgi:hypothetical protein